MQRRTFLGGIVGVAAAGVGAVAVAELFLPEQSTMVGEADASTGTVLRRGTFEGQTGHDVAGTVELRRDDDSHALRFVDYEQTQGPDVFVYLTPSPTPETAADVAAGTKVLVDGGADGGESTKEGTFTQRLPAALDVSEFRGVSIWCDRFSTPFGRAALEAVES
ncbi:DM13 domain-containing protein [Halogeometricum limi]|uniref:Electron transfer DM13 n=1 Tax=Halogeometricum limi TaxID=555875 RepID=A0A1I6G7E3_9EURY|nr:DM13 domain-containing protein [Halogeometricum limi]SFR38041.1 Electron transfer DM13 [Halogeometricum limi]